MHNAAPIPEPTPSSDANYPTTEHASCAAAQRQSDGVDGVGEVRHGGMTVTEWKAAIARANAAWARHNLEYALTGCFAAKGNADRAKLAREQLMAARKASE